VAIESEEQYSLLNVIRALLKLRNGNKSLQEGSLELIENLPNGVLGYTRILKNEKITILLNFSGKNNEFKYKTSNCLFKLSQTDNIKDQTVYLGKFGGIILKNIN
jgi:glycosidase